MHDHGQHAISVLSPHSVSSHTFLRHGSGRMCACKSTAPLHADSRAGPAAPLAIPHSSHLSSLFPHLSSRLRTSQYGSGGTRACRSTAPRSCSSAANQGNRKLVPFGYWFNQFNGNTLRSTGWQYQGPAECSPSPVWCSMRVQKCLAVCTCRSALQL